MYVFISLFIYLFIYSGLNSLAWNWKVKPVCPFNVVGQLRDIKIHNYILLYIKNYRLPGCYFLKNCITVTFWRIVLLPHPGSNFLHSFTLTIITLRSSETPVTLDLSTQRNIRQTRNHSSTSVRCGLRFSGILRRIDWSFWNHVSGQPVFLIFKGKKFQEESWPLKVGSTDCPETSVRIYQYVRRNILQGRRSHISVVAWNHAPLYDFQLLHNSKLSVDLTYYYHE